ncbi:hypothetical protein SprV_0200802500 [Sparganum proliferum]
MLFQTSSDAGTLLMDWKLALNSPVQEADSFPIITEPAEAVHPATSSTYSSRSTTAANCWYHTTFDVKACRCITPCSFTSKQSKRVKRVGPKVSAANLPDGFSPGRTFYAHDTRSGRLFLADNGAQLSIISSTPVDHRCHNPGLFLQAVNTSPITPFGTYSLSLNNGLRRLFPWVIVGTDTSCAIIGADFLTAFNLLVDCHQSRLHDKLPTSQSRVSLPPTLPINSPSWTLNPKIHFGSSSPNTPASLIPNSVLPFHHTTLFTTSGPLVPRIFFAPAVSRLQVLLPPTPSSSVRFRGFTVLTNHKSLSFALKSTPDKLNPRKNRQLHYISQFTSEIRHIDGSRNEVADALSRLSVVHLQFSPGIHLTEMVAKQRLVGSPCDKDVCGLQLQDLSLTTGNGSIPRDNSATSYRPSSARSSPS